MLTMFMIRYVVFALLILVTASKIQNECVLDLLKNNLRDIYCKFIPYEIDISYLNGTTRLDVSENDIEELYLTSGQNVTLNEINLSKNNISNPCTVKFNQVIHVNSLVLSHNQVKYFSICSTPKNLTLSWNSIQSLNKTDMINATYLEVLDLSYNNILWIENDTFSDLINIQWLNLRGNRLTRISEWNLPSNTLQHLDLSENHRLDQTTAFQPFEILVELNIAQNVDLAPAILVSSPRLQKLDVSFTNLIEVPTTSAPLLGSLNLSGNMIKSIRSGDLDGFPLLKKIDISLNRISYVEDDAFGRLDLLTILDLSDNLLEIVPKSLPDRLEILNLSGNRINNLTMEDFQGCKRLKKINIRNNRLSYIQDFTFSSLTFLDILDVSENPIQLITREMLVGPVRLKHLIMEKMEPLETVLFPFTDTQYLSHLRLMNSSHLAAILFNDSAVFSSLLQLEYLDIMNCNIKVLPSNLPYYMPKMRNLFFNKLDCFGEWFKEWMCEIHSSWEKYNYKINLTNVRLRNVLPTLKKTPIDQLYCIDNYGQEQLVYDIEYCAAITTTSIKQNKIIFTEPTAVFERLRAKTEPKISQVITEVKHPGIVVFFVIILSLIFLVFGSILIGIRTIPIKNIRWKQSNVDVNYQSIEIKSLESLNYVERW
ncbi:slit homolog 2 protein [Daktulosphaira vitifoliae]|uniref:slit homolog 2 protein n=1 Tax=Daktulosphaira vitifoliae TaxID=58002 RepID=UPI0021AA1D05|nr:slit homolog 2 protein [Daktulosphaira vitifoliae]